MNRVSVITATVLATLVCGCANTPPSRYEQSFGEAVRQARALQLVDPAASRNTDPVTGVDGRAARAAIDLYQESFRAPPRSFEVLGIGGLGR